MNLKNGIKPYILLLIGLMTLGIFTRYVPHHHHEGKFCVEQTEDIAHDDTSHDNCSFESSNIEFKGISKTSCNSVPHPLYFASLFSADFSKETGEHVMPSVIIPAIHYAAYCVKAHKLRGSPVFS